MFPIMSQKGSTCLINSLPNNFSKLKALSEGNGYCDSKSKICSGKAENISFVEKENVMYQFFLPFPFVF